MKKLKNLLYPVAARIIINIKDSNSITELFRKTDYTLSHCFMILKMMEKEGFITTEKIGRVRSVKLTKKGNQLNDTLNELRRLTK